MGTCTSKTNSKTKKEHVIINPPNFKQNDHSKSSTSALFQSVFKIASPFVRRIISKILLDDYEILRNEKPVGKYKPGQPDETLPIHPIGFNFKDIVIVDPECIRKEKKQFPDFEWPKHNLNDASNDMIVLDLIDFDCSIRLAQGIEISVPIPPMPFGVTGNLEIGANHKSIQEASVRFQIPKLRIWYIHGDIQTLYIAFWGRPNLIPHYGINADFGRGDIFSMEFTKDGSLLDDVVEKILSGFGPEKFYKQTSTSSSDGGNAKQSSGGNLIGGAIVQILSKWKNTGYGRPIVVNLRDKIQPSINKLLTDDVIVPKTVEKIKADMKMLELELEQMEQTSTKNNGTRVMNNHRSINHTAELKDNNAWLTKNMCSFDSLCGT